MFELFINLLSSAKIARAPNKPWLLPLHEHGHVAAVVLWRKTAREHSVSTSEKTNSLTCPKIQYKTISNDSILNLTKCLNELCKVK